LWTRKKQFQISAQVIEAAGGDSSAVLRLGQDERALDHGLRAVGSFT
jgi:hypothetical protein